MVDLVVVVDVMFDVILMLCLKPPLFVFFRDALFGDGDQ